MSNKNTKRYKKIQKRVDSNNSFFNKYPNLTINRYWIPKQYLDAVFLTIDIYRSGIPFNKAVDQAFAVSPNNLNRNKLAEHTLKYIANDY